MPAQDIKRVKWSYGKSLLWLCSIMIIIFSQANAQDANCDFFQDVEMGQTYYIYSKNYPKNYTTCMTCRWQAVCPVGTVCRLNCPEVDIPVVRRRHRSTSIKPKLNAQSVKTTLTTDCSADRLLVSVTGDHDLTGADKYCGKGTLDASSTSNLLSVGLISAKGTPGGKFMCTLTAQNQTSAILTADCDCGWKKKTRIVGGTQTQINEFPMMVALVDIQLKMVYCGATIIHNRYLLTAAHCVALEPEISNIGVLYGEHNIKLDDSNASKLIKVEQAIKHPQYSDGYDYDIALIKTSEDIIYSEQVGPACLPFKFESDYFVNLTVEALGWGTQSFGGIDSDYLQKVGLNVVDQDSCKAILGNVITPRSMCTYNAEKDACQHDSGGPIMYNDPTNGREYIAGVIIGGYGCASTKPGINSRITEYIDWITANTPDASYCTLSLEWTKRDVCAALRVFRRHSDKLGKYNRSVQYDERMTVFPTFADKLKTSRLILLLSIFSLIHYHSVNSQDANCDYFQSISAGQTFYVYSSNYPNNYGPGKTCRWQAQCPTGTVCRLNCAEINLPATTGCTGDRLLVSKTGDPTLTGADKYCGKGSLDVLSTSNKISIGFISTNTSPGGRFVCTLTAQSGSGTGTNCDCGWKKQTRIVGGQQTQINEFPMMVGLVDIQLRIVYCGATIIHTKWVVTAAHCISNQKVTNVGVLYGEHNIKLNDSPVTTLIQAVQFIRHPQYADGYDYDIGLIRTEVDIVYSDRVGPACLPFKYALNSMTGATVEALGWGTQSFAGADSDYLQKVNLKVIDQTSCTNSLGNVVTPRTMCTYTSGKDACQHDSGGPLLYQDLSSGREYLVGIIIGGYGCATTRPGLNSRITEYLNWITANTPGANYCNK
ncbi:transmembrane protease serine 9-like [Arctopsyche grandis]|uniref:transmembrane protease serine 9-like n=1 Tax=Arctopsyche grandis TaxID=121162 RepID=UPI00406D95C6